MPKEPYDRDQAQRSYKKPNANKSKRFHVVHSQDLGDEPEPPDRCRHQEEYIACHLGFWIDPALLYNQVLGEI